MTLDLDTIEAKARAATPGPWADRTEIGHPGVRCVAAEGAFDWVCSMQVSNSPRWVADAAHIASADPTTVLCPCQPFSALVARIRELEALLASSRAP